MSLRAVLHQCCSFFAAVIGTTAADVIGLTDAAVTDAAVTDANCAMG